MISLPPKGSDAKKLGAYFTPLKVEAQATPNMTVKVAEGSFWTANNEYMEYIGGTSPTISAPGSDAKWVLVTVTNTGMINVVNGVASGTPDLPPTSSYKNELPLAAIFIGDTTTAISSDMIYDLRPMWSIPPDSVSQTQLNDFATITYVDNGLNTKANFTGTPEANFTLNVGGSSINDSGLYVDRFSGPNVGIRFNETVTGSPAVPAGWQFTNDGVTWNPIGVASGSYYTKADLQGGALDFLYYTHNDLNVSGVLDGRYYTETETDANFAPLIHTHVAADITDFPVAGYVETINTIAPVLGNVTLNLNDLNDVSNASPTNKHVIVMRSGAYVNDFLSTDDLLDVDTTATTPTIGDVLIHNGGGFINRPLVKNDIADFLGTEFVLVTNVAGDAPAGDGPPDSNGVAQDIYGVKTFKDGLNIETSLTVSGSNTSIQTTELRVTDPYVDINFGETGTGVGNGSGVSGIRVDRGPAGSPANPPAIIQWDEAAGQWEFGVEGNSNPILGGAHTHNSSQITDFAARVITELNNNTLTKIQDVNYLTSPATGEYLRYGIASWENKNFATDVIAELNSNDLNQLQDVVYLGSPALTSGDFLQWNGTAWENHVAVKADVSDFVEADYLHTNASAEVKAGDLTINGNFTVGGGLGTITTINSETVNILDSVITLNSGETGNGVAGGTGTGGIQVDRGAFDDAMMWWSEPAGTWLAHYSVTGGSPVSSSLVVGQISFVGHNHLVSDITDLSVNATEINTLVGINTAFTVQQQLDDKITRQGDSMDNGANLTFAVGGEVLGLPATPSATAASSKEYVDTEVARKIDRTGDAMDLNANLTFSGTGEVLGLPATPSATAATSKEYVDTHIADLTLHMTVDQNAFFDGLTLTGSPALTAADVNRLIGISGNVQTLLDTKTDKLTPVVDQNLAAIDIVTGNIVDSGVVVNDAANTVNEIWTANKIDTTKADKIIPALTNNLAGLDVTGNLADSGLILNDAGTLVSEIWSANKINTTKVDKVPTAVVGNFGEFDAIGNLIDGGNNASTFAQAVHTHTSSEITDWSVAFTSELGINSINSINDVDSSGAVSGDMLRWNGLTWQTTNTTSITEFVHRTGSIPESINGVKTFSDNAFFQQNVSVAQALTVNGSIAVTGNLTVTGDQIIQGDEVISTNDLTLNYGSSDPTSANGGGIRLQRDVTLGSPPVLNAPNAVITWDHATSRWEAGLDISVQPVALENVTVAAPDYELKTGSGAAAYVYTFSVAAPAAGKASLQIFVNGIKQIEGAGKAYTVNYGTNTVTFNAGSIPLLGDDVEFYGFGVIG